MTDRFDPSSATEGVAPSDPRLRELFQALPRRRAAGEECPQPVELWASARGEVDPERNRWLLGHTGRCPSCAEDWRLARHLERSGAMDVAPAAASVHTGADSGRLRRFALAATVILAVAVAALWTTQAGLERQPPVDRSADQQRIGSLIPEDQPLSREEPVLRWRPPEGAENARYDLTVTDQWSTPLHRVERLETTWYRLPDSVIDPLPPGTELLWQVEATLPDRSPVPSTTFRVTIE